MSELLLWLLLAQVGDLTTTGIALNRGCMEAVYLPRAPYVGMAAKGGFTVTLTMTLPSFHKRRPKLAKGLAVAVAASSTFATVWNARQLPRCRR